MSTTPPFEIPTDMLKMIEQSMEQVGTAINGYLQFFQRSVPSNLMELLSASHIFNET